MKRTNSCQIMVIPLIMKYSKVLLTPNKKTKTIQDI